TRILPGAGVVAIRGIKHATLALRPDPRPGFFALTFWPDLQDMAVRLVVLGMHVGLVPGAERFEAPHKPGSGNERPGLTTSLLVAKELRAHQFDILRRIEEAVRGTMERHKTAPFLDKVEQRLLLGWADPSGIGVDNQGVVTRQGLAVEVIQVLGIGDLDAPPG